MEWHSTRMREELLIALDGRAYVEARSSHRISRIALDAGQCLFLPAQTLHRVLNRSTTRVRYIYVTAPVLEQHKAKRVAQ